MYVHTVQVQVLLGHILILNAFEFNIRLMHR